MKKCILFFSCLIVTVAAFAQRDIPKAVTGTMTNTTPTYVKVSLQGEKAARNVMYQVVVDKVSGTIGGTVFVDYSADGVNFVKIPGTDSLALGNSASQFRIWKVDHNAGYWIRARATGNNTGVATVKLYVVQKY